MTNKDLTGKFVESRLEFAGITTNKNMIPYDEKSPMVTSGIRIGTPALTTRGMKENEMSMISHFIDNAIRNINDDDALLKIRNQVKDLCSMYPLNQEPQHEMS